MHAPTHGAGVGLCSARASAPSSPSALTAADNAASPRRRARMLARREPHPIRMAMTGCLSRARCFAWGHTARGALSSPVSPGTYHQRPSSWGSPFPHAISLFFPEMYHRLRVLASIGARGAQHKRESLFQHTLGTAQRRVRPGSRGPGLPRMATPLIAARTCHPHEKITALCQGAAPTAIMTSSSESNALVGRSLSEEERSSRCWRGL